MMLNTIKRWAIKLYCREDGVTSVEYAINLALVISLCISTIGRMTTNTTETFNTVSSKLGRSASS